MGAKLKDEEKGSAARPPATPENYPREVEIMSMYIDSAKNYVKLGASALALSITFVRGVMGVPEGTRVSFVGCPGVLLAASWVLFLFAVGAGAFYQFLAVRYLESKSSLPDIELPSEGWLRDKIESPGDVYDWMMWLFHLAAVAFTISAIWRLATHS